MPRSDRESISVGYSIRWKRREAASRAFTTSGMKEEIWPADWPQNAMAKKTRNTSTGPMLPSSTKFDPTQNARAYIKKSNDWEKANTAAYRCA